ncbi:XRE family transcriptional regulator [Salmonella enterica subsp. enterica]|nr:XRE family transcriptional regulator [Salmonella enterica subsp. enterica serovar Newport]EBY6714252.1 XRE family transcriptional regulator [Salmonella enterica subsp. enterica serovar Kottbus]
MNDSNHEHFKGLSLEPEIAFHQIAAMIETGVIISAIDSIDDSDLSDNIFYLAKKYAEAAHNHARNIRRSALTEAPLAPVKIMQGVDMSGVGKRIRESRVSRRMTSEELENAAHLPEGVTSVWESGKAYPPDEALDKLAKALNTSVTWLLTGRQITEEDA